MFAGKFARYVVWGLAVREFVKTGKVICLETITEGKL
jgi:hypothetical protein